MLVKVMQSESVCLCPQSSTSVGTSHVNMVEYVQRPAATTSVSVS